MNWIETPAWGPLHPVAAMVTWALGLPDDGKIVKERLAAGEAAAEGWADGLAAAGLGLGLGRGAGLAAGGAGLAAGGAGLAAGDGLGLGAWPAIRSPVPGDGAAAEGTGAPVKSCWLAPPQAVARMHRAEAAATIRGRSVMRPV
ncbi:MAG: hypothetical protein NVSMB32_03130 [Actinomycetota bacterium]